LTAFRGGLTAMLLYNETVFAAAAATAPRLRREKTSGQDYSLSVQSIPPSPPPSLDSVVVAVVEERRLNSFLSQHIVSGDPKRKQQNQQQNYGIQG
jgi:hypothetical protein